MSLSVSLFNLIFGINMTSYHLRKTEVQYELKIRGISAEGSAGELRKRLSQCLSTNTPVDDNVVKSLDVESELEECEATLSDLLSLVGDYDGNFRDNEFQRLTARLWHLYYRVERIPTDATVDVEFDQRKTELLIKSKGQIDSFTVRDPADKVKSAPLQQESSTQELMTPSVPRMSTTNTSSDLMSFIDPKVQPTTSHVPSVNTVTVQAHPPLGLTSGKETSPVFSQPCGTLRSKSIPVYKWGIKFDNSSSQSIGAFLERVEELRRARGVSQRELFESAVDLFSGPALIWYRSTLARISSWEELCKELRTVFQAPDYEIRLQQEIFSRLQGDHEPIDMFIAAMEGLYVRLASSVPESIRLKQIIHNLHPQLQDRLALFEIKTLEDLRHLGRKAEAGRLRSLTRPQSHQNQTLEPDLACAENLRRRPHASHPIGKIASSQVKDSSFRLPLCCWNCGQDGHRFSSCQNQRKRFCYGCGTPDVIKINCPKCGSKNGQGREPATSK
jgi:hypothetical protein